MRKSVSLILLLLWTVCPIIAQSDDEEPPRSVNESTLVGVGGYNVKDTYLSPLKYTGWGLRVLNERMKVVKLADYNISRQQIINVDFSSTHNPAETATDFTGFVDYRLGYHYRFQPRPDLRILAGASAHASAGFVYNTRNGNNPASAKGELDLNLSAMVLYNLRIKGYPLTLRYQLETPFVGMTFSPHYGQAYYEIFDLGNRDGIIKVTSFHNKFALRNYFTVDFPIGGITIRTGYLNSSYRMDVNNIQSHVISHSFMIGFVKEFISFGGKHLKKTHKYRSAYY
ncbi:MAG: DUF3316 domain-containing protein [Tannerellaceae bacterium]